jgi:hypothetical protein
MEIGWDAQLVNGNAPGPQYPKSHNATPDPLICTSGSRKLRQLWAPCWAETRSRPSERGGEVKGAKRRRFGTRKDTYETQYDGGFANGGLTWKDWLGKSEHGRVGYGAKRGRLLATYRGGRA